MNDFEKRILAEYEQNHHFSVDQEVIESVLASSDKDDREKLMKKEAAVATMLRLLYIALEEYHTNLSQYLMECGVSLPDFDTLLSFSARQKDD